MRPSVTHPPSPAQQAHSLPGPADHNYLSFFLVSSYFAFSVRYPSKAALTLPTSFWVSRFLRSSFSSVISSSTNERYLEEALVYVSLQFRRTLGAD